MIDKPTVAVVPMDEKTAALNAIVAAFAADPIIRWILPKADIYLTHAANFFAQFGGPAFAAGTAFQAADYAGAALWVPPGHEDEQAEEVVAEMLT